MGFSGLYTSVSGMMTTKISLDTVSHNIANSNNPHYVRQSALHKDSYYENMQVGAVMTNQKGHGVSVSRLRQIRDEFLDKQIRRELPRLGYYGVKSETLTDVEGIFNEITASGLQTVMDDFWDSWHELHKDPSSLTNRGLVRETGLSFVNTVNSIGKQLKDVQKNIDVELRGKVDETNQILDEIASLNKRIKLAEAEGPNVSYNDLLDQRNALLDRISQLLPVKTYEDDYGSVEITLKGKTIVSEDFVKHLEVLADPDKTDGKLSVYWENTNDKVDMGKDGELGALIYVRDEFIEKDLFLRIDSLVKSVADSVNKIHSKAYNLNGETGIPFFITSNELNKTNPDPEDLDITAINIVLNPELDKLNNIAVSATGAGGDGDMAEEIYELRDNLKINLKEIYEDLGLDTGGLSEMDDIDYSIDDFYRRIITNIGLEREEALNNLQAQSFLVQSIDQKRASISSPSLDEDMADLIKFQYSYMANSRVFNTIDEMIDVLVNRVGIVGR